MSSEGSGVTQALNVKNDVEDSPVKRTVAKIRHPRHAMVSSTAAEKRLEASGDGNDVHVTTEEYANSAGHAVISQVGKYLQEDEAQDLLSSLSYSVKTGGRDFYVELFQSSELQDVVRMAGRELILGVSEGLLQKRSGMQPIKLPKVITTSVLPVAAIFTGLLLLGLTLALWRFALFGLHL